MKEADDRVGGVAAVVLERAINAWLATDPRGAGRLAEIEGVVVGLEVTTLQLTLFFFPESGRVRVAAATGRSPDTWIRGGLFDLLKLAVGDSRGGVRLVIEGDVVVGQTFQHILRDGDFDWEELLAMCLGDVAAHESVRGLRAVGHWTAYALDSLNAAAGEYLREEVRLVPGDREVREFVREVDELRDKVESLDVRAAGLRMNEP